MKDGGPAFPMMDQEWKEHPGMSLRQYFAIHAPEPTEGDIRTEMAYDRNRDPHNDRNGIRGKLEIIAALRYRYADAMIAEGEKKHERWP